MYVCMYVCANVQLWSLESMKLIKTLLGPEGVIYSIRYTTKNNSTTSCFFDLAMVSDSINQSDSRRKSLSIQFLT